MSKSFFHLIALFAGCLLPVSAALALPILADISAHRVEIHSAFTGTQLLVFGARNDPGDVVVVVRGPQANYTVRKKARVAGIWVNHEQALVKDTPKFFRIASSKSVADVRHFNYFEPLNILPPYLLEEQPQDFQSALYRMLANENLHSQRLGKIEFMGPTLFKAVFDFPDHMPRGEYTAEAYLFTDGALSGVHIIPVEVYKIGTDAFLYRAAKEYSLLYGLLAVMTALVIGSGISWIFKRLG